MEKQPFLVCYDYDPELDVVYERPSFMSEGMYQDRGSRVARNRRSALGSLNVLLADRRRC